jgi:asparagine synthase (glutamine-hydrolysing)
MIDGISFFKCSKDAKLFVNKSCIIFQKYHPNKFKTFEFAKNIWVCRESNKISNSHLKGEKKIKVLFSGELFENLDNIEEYIYKLYINNSLDKVSYLNGSFSIIIYDEIKSKTILLSDRLCTKPLYYWVSNDRYSISSSLQALLSDNRIPRTIDSGGIIELIANQRVSGNTTQYKHIKSLAGSEIVTITGSGVKSRFSRVFKWSKTTSSKKQIAEKLSEAFKKSFAKRYFPNSSQALLLSGGLDSRIVLAAATANNIDLPTMTLCSHYNNEAKIAKKCSEISNQNFKFIQVPTERLTSAFEDSVLASDGLYAAPINLFGSLRNISRDYNVLFSGHGIDYTLRGMYLPKFQVRGRTSATNIPILLPLNIRNGSIAKTIQPFLEKNKNWKSVFVKHNIHKYERILVDSISASLNHLEFDNPYDAIDAYIFSTQSKHYTCGDFIAMSRIINNRSIAFDPEVLEVYFSMSPYLRISGGIVRMALNMLNPNLAKIKNANNNLPANIPLWLQSTKVIGKSILHRTGLTKPNNHPNKIFTSSSWVQYSELLKSNEVVTNYIDNLVKDEHLLDLGIFSRKSLNKVVNQHMSGEKNYAKTLHSMISLSLWLKNHS